MNISHEYLVTCCIKIKEQVFTWALRWKLVKAENETQALSVQLEGKSTEQDCYISTRDDLYHQLENICESITDLPPDSRQEFVVKCMSTIKPEDLKYIA